MKYVMGCFEKTFCRLSLSKTNKKNGLVGAMKSCENCLTYFITKDTKLCKSFSPLFLNAHLYFFLLSPSLYFFFAILHDL